jgi:serine protease
MKRINTVVGFGLFFLIIGLCIGFTFLFHKQEKKYSEFIISVNPRKNMDQVLKVADQYGFSMQAREFAFKAENSFTRKHKLYKVFKYDIQPEEINDVLDAFSRLKAESLIQAVEPNYQVKTFANDTLYKKQWNLQQLKMDDVWKKATGKGVVVAVIDTGVSTKLGDLSAARLVKGYNFVTRNKQFEDDHGHGSHVAGTIAQDTNNNKGVAGIAYDARIMPLKVLDKSGRGNIMGIAEAIVYAVDNGAHVINMSLGGGGFSQVLKDACDYAYEKNVIVVAAAGNENNRSSSYPGRYESVISVAASNPDFERSYFSNYGTGVDVIAPGGEMKNKSASGILQNAPDFLPERNGNLITEGNDAYYFFQGTSMASPHVAGISAVLYQLGVKKPADMRKLLIASSEKKIADLPLVNPVGAITKLSGGPIKGPDKIPVEPEKPRFNTGPITTSTTISLLTLLVAFIMYFIFNKTRKKVRAIENLNKPMTFLGLILGANGIALAGYFLQRIFPFTFLPERFTGLLFNSILDYDRVLFFLSKPSLFWHNFLIPLFFMIVLNFKDETKRRFTVGLILGFAAKLISDGIFVREMALIPDGFPAMFFLVINGLIVFLLPYVLVKNE